ncbi:DedA family protein [Alkalicoccobacillus porphyridii]|uniref:DedA family protein n=1 Tax=Alkalicoccobacillus porphyridii TaxID=2597270 RepID=A0A554A1S7_9BACI|nr:DedA family protein [Alkalicoccobacillus porphyridii]TSB47650.1 DedA family protein [Alkalicoccobacillus porphyridii]
MEEWIQSFMEQYGYFGIFLMITLENLFPPIPSEVILTFGGFMTTTTDMSVSGVIIASTAGSVFGAICLYGAGFLLGVSRLERLVDTYGRILRIKRTDLHKADAWFNHYGMWTVFFGRMVPLIRSLISIPAGIAKMPFILFLLCTALGTAIWNTVLVILGARLGESWEDVLAYMSVYSNAVYAVIAIVVILLIIFFFRKRRRP